MHLFAGDNNVFTSTAHINVDRLAETTDDFASVACDNISSDTIVLNTDYKSIYGDDWANDELYLRFKIVGEPLVAGDKIQIYL